MRIDRELSVERTAKRCTCGKHNASLDRNLPYTGARNYEFDDARLHVSWVFVSVSATIEYGRGRTLAGMSARRGAANHRFASDRLSSGHAGEPHVTTPMVLRLVGSCPRSLRVTVESEREKRRRQKDRRGPSPF